MYKELENQVNKLELHKGESTTYRTESSDLIRLENSTLRQEISELNHRIS